MGRYCYVPLLVYAAMGTSSFVSVGPVALVSTTLHGMIAYVADPAARYHAIPSPYPSPARNSTLSLTLTLTLSRARALTPTPPGWRSPRA